MSEERIWRPLWSAISNKIDRELPGEPLWSQAIPIENGDIDEGLAIRREEDHYILVYFQLVPIEVDPAGEMIGGQRADDWDIQLGYQQNFATLQETKEHAKRLLADLPTPEHMQGRGYDFFLNLLEA